MATAQAFNAFRNATLSRMNSMRWSTKMCSTPPILAAVKVFVQSMLPLPTGTSVTGLSSWFVVAGACWSTSGTLRSSRLTRR